MGHLWHVAHVLGALVGNYRIVAEIGGGGMGTVYQAEHDLIGRKVAIKMLRPTFASRQRVVARFFNEARAATAIRHPGIVEIYDCGYYDQRVAYIVMELLSGESLAARLRRVRQLTPVVALRFMRQIASALSVAHANEIVHRDLKPGNIFLVPDPDIAGGERTKLLDFGIAKLMGDGAASVKTRTGAIMGTPTYMSPEQCRGAGDVDHRADIYSLGCIMFRMLAGRPPFVTEGVGNLLAAHICRPPPLIRDFAPTLSRDFAALVDRMLQKDPAMRPQTAREVAAIIDGLLHDALRAHSAPSPANPMLDSSASTLLAVKRPPPARWAPQPARRVPRWQIPLITSACLIAVGILVLQLASSEQAGVASSRAALGDGRGEDAAAEDASGRPASPGHAASPPDDHTATIRSSPERAVVFATGDDGRDRLLGYTPLRVPVADVERTYVLRRDGFEPHTLIVAPNAAGMLPTVVLMETVGRDQ